MGKKSRAERRRGNVIAEKQTKRFYMTEAEVKEQAHEYAQKHFETIKDELTRQITNAISEAWCYLIARSLEDTYKLFNTEENPHVGFRKIRKITRRFLQYMVLLDTTDLTIKDIVEDLNKRGFYLYEEEVKDQ